MRVTRRRALVGGAVVALGVLEAGSFAGWFDHRRDGMGFARARFTSSSARLDGADGVVHVGQSTHLISLGGTRLLTDPWFYDPAFGALSHAPAVPPEEIGRLDAILVTHDHADHADMRAIDRLDKRATAIVATADLAARVRARGFSTVHVLAVGEQAEVAGVRVTAVEAQHDIYEVGYVMEKADRHVYFAGDSRFFDGLAAVGERFPPDLAILPVDGTRLRGGPVRVMDPASAVQAARVVRAKHVMPSHADAVFSDPVTHLLATTVDGASQIFGAAMARDLPYVKCSVPAPGDLVLL